MKAISFVVFIMQIMLLKAADIYFMIINNIGISCSKKYEYVIGVEEIASYLHLLSTGLENSCTICYGKHKFYNAKYNFHIHSKYKIIYIIKRIIYGPVLLAKLSKKTKNFIYLWKSGFLYDLYDCREYEFRYLKKNGIKITCMFLGDDIRSVKKSIQFSKENDIELASQYYQYVYPDKCTDEYDEIKKNIAKVTDKYADFIFSAKVDQISYIKRQTKPVPYFYPEEKYNRNEKKFSNINKIKIVHSPSSPIIKGTQLVRAAIRKLRNEGYNFEYIELIGVSNEKVLETLRNSHISINEFYSMSLGIYGVESISNYCALVTSANDSIEGTFQEDSRNAWLTTRPDQVYDHIKMLLDDINLIKEYAEAGFVWSLKNISHKNSIVNFKKMINENK